MDAFVQIQIVCLFEPATAPLQSKVIALLEQKACQTNNLLDNKEYLIYSLPIHCIMRLSAHKIGAARHQDDYFGASCFSIGCYAGEHVEWFCVTFEEHRISQVKERPSMAATSLPRRPHPVVSAHPCIQRMHRHTRRYSVDCRARFPIER